MSDCELANIKLFLILVLIHCIPYISHCFENIKYIYIDSLIYYYRNPVVKIMGGRVVVFWSLALLFCSETVCFTPRTFPYNHNTRLWISGQALRAPRADSYRLPSLISRARNQKTHISMSNYNEGGLNDEAVLGLLKRVANAKSRMFEMPIVVLDAMLPRQ